MRKSPFVRYGCLIAALTASLARTVSAQTIGPISWQLQPYCNVVTLMVEPVGATFRLEGFDDQCGAATQASIVGSAFFNPNGTVGLGFNIVATPGGAPVHVDATLTLPALTGLWRDSVGGTGTFAFGPPAGGLPPRPIGATGPTIMTIVPGAGLLGGGSASTVNVDVNFAGSGAATTVAHSDHTHGIATRNTAIGDGALNTNATGMDNTALGFNALASSTAAGGNVAIGSRALFSLSSQGAGGNVAIGDRAMFSATSPSGNVAVGGNALQQNTSGSENVALGQYALRDNDLGLGNVAVGRLALSFLNGGAHRNIALGYEAGINVLGGSDNILIGNTGVAGDDSAIRIGSTQTRAFIAGIHGGTVDAMTALAVSVDADGRLGTMASSARFKTDITDVEAESRLLQRLRPVSFRYLPVEPVGAPRQFGLIAEQVADVMPELVVNDADGQPYTVRYHLLPPLLLAEVQRLERERQAQEDRIAELTRELTALRARVGAILAGQPR
jgi:hypothetical protein